MKRKIKINAAVWFLLPYAVLFIVFIVIPVIAAIVLSFTNFDAVQFPKFVDFLNYINLLTQDDIFMQYVLPNTCIFAFMCFYIYLRGCDALRKNKTEGASEISEALFIHMPT